MPSTLPCPNPVCTHVFNAEAVRGAASVVCPRCGTKLEFRAPAARTSALPPKAAPPKRPAAPKAAPAKPVAPPPPAKPVPPPLARPIKPPPPPAAPPAAPAVPLATPVTAAPSPSALTFDSKSDMVLAPRRRRRGLPGWLIALLLVVGVFGGMAALFLGAILNGNSWRSPAPAGPSTPLTEENKAFVQQGNFHIEAPAPPWTVAPELRGVLGSVATYRRSKPASSMALAFHDYHTRLPRDAELIDEALNKLRGAMTGVEYEVKPKDEQTTLGGQPAVRLEFQANDHDVPVHGECVATAFHGIAYWFFTWAPVDDAPGLTDEWAGLRGKFVLSDQREGWTETPPKTAAVKGVKLPYKLDYIESVWEKQEEPEKYGPLDDAALLGYDPKDKDARVGADAATAQVLALDKAADLHAAVQEAADALLEIEKGKQAGGGGYLFPGAVLNPVTDKGLNNTDADLKVSGFDGHVVKFEAKQSADQSKYVVLEVVKMDEGVLAVACESAWDRRDFWDQEFTALLARLKPGKGK